MYHARIILTILFIALLLGCNSGEVREREFERLQSELRVAQTHLNLNNLSLIASSEMTEQLFREVNNAQSVINEMRDWYKSRVEPDQMLIWSVDSSLIDRQIKYLRYLHGEVYESARPVWGKWFINRLFNTIDAYTPFEWGESLDAANKVFAVQPLVSKIWTMIKPIIVPLVQISGDRDLVLRKAIEFRQDIAWNSTAIARVDSVVQNIIDGIQVPEIGEGSDINKSELYNWYRFYRRFGSEFQENCRRAKIAEKDVDFATLRYRWQIKVFEAGGDFNHWHAEVLRIIDDFIEAIQ